MQQLRLVEVPFPSEKVCGWCQLSKPRASFSRQIHSRDGLQPACKDCYAKNWREHHNIQNEPPIPRWSPYDVVGEHLVEIEQALAEMDLEGAKFAVIRFREKLRLVEELG